ncbi:MAG: Hpt domain-containing protein [Treponema sp.]|nr:Hpt domain-containing protein [Treponema sp.]
MADLVYIDEEDGKKRVMNNGKLYARLLTKFTTGTNLDMLFTSLDAQDWETAQNAAHTIKGVAANLSLTELYNQSLDVETQVKGKTINPDSLEKLKTCFTETLSAAEKVIEKYA